MALKYLAALNEITEKLNWVTRKWFDLKLEEKIKPIHCRQVIMHTKQKSAGCFAQCKQMMHEIK